MNTSKTIPAPLDGPIISYYPFARLAERVLAIEFCYDGNVRPMNRTAAVIPPTPITGWNDVSVYTGKQVAEGCALPFTVSMDNDGDGICVVEFAGWGRPYNPTIANIFGASWPFGHVEVSYNEVANAGGVECLKKMAFQFVPNVDGEGNPVATLSWSTGTAPVQGCGSILLDSQNLKFAYVVLRLNQENHGRIFTDLSFGTDAARNPLQVLLS
jgi:hypothetical protein